MPQHRFTAFSKRNLLLSASAIALISTYANAADLPVNGQIVGGSGNISQSGNIMTVTQTSGKMAANWDSFSIGKGNTVNFVQPSSNSVALNNVLGSDVSVIQGGLTANGKIFIINPNGVLFTPTSQVSVGGLVASTQNISTADFMAGNYKFQGTSSNAIINQGNIITPEGGTVALIAAKILNQGNIETPKGNTLMGAGNTVRLDLGGPVKLEIEEGALKALIEQGGAIRADGGHVYLTAKAAGDLASATINHTGVTEAKTISTGEKGEIVLLGDMKNGTVNVGGTLDASAPSGGDGGFIETSAANVNTKAGLKLSASSKKGKAGEWLIDPYNYVIDSTAAGNIGTTLSGGTNVTITTASNVASTGSDGNAAGLGDININSAISTTNNTPVTLTMRAANSIVVDANISSANNALNLVLDADNDGGTRDGGGIIILNKNITTHGGNIDFGTGATLAINGVTTKVGGDVYVGGAGAVTLNSGGGNVTVNGEMLIANTNGLNINTSNGNVTFGGIINSGNSYDAVNSTGTWQAALNAAKSGTGGSVGDTYLATITSRLENAVAGRTVSYQPSWLGGQRVTGIGTNNLWRWVGGPEGLMDGGNGLAFFQQNGDPVTVNGSGGVNINGGFSNWNGGEPNNSGGETALQFIGNLGKWNDLQQNSGTLGYYVRETNLAPSPLAINAGSGNVTFNGNVGGNKVLDSLTVNAATIAINGGGVKTAGTQTYNGDISLGSANTTLEMTNAGTDFTLGTGRSVFNNYSSGPSSFTIKTTGSITLEQDTDITSPSSAMNTTLWSDSDATGGGYIWLQGDGTNGVDIFTHGGNLTLSGGADTSTGYATGVAGGHGNGITIDTSILTTAGGNINIRGKSATSGIDYVSSDAAITGNVDGIRLHGSNLFDSGTGNIALTGVARSTNLSSNGIETNSTGYTSIISSSTSANAITLDGSAPSGSATNGWGTFLWGNSGASIVLSATGTGGGVNITGTGRDGVANAGGVHLEPNAFVLASNGPITITGAKGSTSTYEDVVVNGTIGFTPTLPGAYGYASPVTSSSSNITINADSLSADRVFGDGTFTGSAVQSSGTLTIAPRTAGKAMNIQTANPGAGPLWINPTALFGSSGLFKTGFNKIVFGKSTTGTVTLDNYLFSNDTEVNTGSNIVFGSANVGNNTLTANVTGSGTITDTNRITADKLKLNGPSASVNLDSNGNTVHTLAANVASINFITSAALTIGSVGGMDGITASGGINIATYFGDLTVAKDVTTTDTSANAIVLNAAKYWRDAGEPEDGDIILSGGPNLTTGTGGRTTLFTGSISGSTGVTTAAGAGHVRYNSDESATNYTSALGSGIYAIFREAPVITVTAANDSKIYDRIAYSGGNGVNYSGFVNGDTSAVISGSVAYSGNSQGAIHAGSYDITPGSLSNGLGYGFNYINGALTIGKSTLTYNADPAIVNERFPFPQFTGSVTGFASGDNINNATTGTLAFTSPVTETVAPGSYQILGSGLSAVDYDFAQAGGNTLALTILGSPILSNVVQTAQATSSMINTNIVTSQLPPTIPVGANNTPIITANNNVYGNAVGTMEMVEVNSRSSSQDFSAQGGGQATAPGLMKVFVVDGGVRLTRDKGRR